MFNSQNLSLPELTSDSILSYVQREADSICFLSLYFPCFHSSHHHWCLVQRKNLPPCLPSATLASLESTPLTRKPERSLNINQMGSSSCSKHLSPADLLCQPHLTLVFFLAHGCYFCLRVFAILFPTPRHAFPYTLGLANSYSSFRGHPTVTAPEESSLGFSLSWMICHHSKHDFPSLLNQAGHFVCMILLLPLVPTAL